MKSFQKIVKYIAIALSIAVLVGLATIISDFFDLLDTNSKSDKENLVELTLENDEFTDLSIEIEASSLEIKLSDKLQVFTNSDKVSCKIKNNTLFIKEKDKSFVKNDEKSVVLYLPTDFTADAVKIEGGAGKILIDSLVCNELNFKIGAGSVVLTNLNVTSKAEIVGGVGSFDINNAKINTFDIVLGAGSANVTAKICNGKIQSGIGDLVLNLKGDMSDYTIRSEAGIGDILVDNERIEGTATTGDGDNVINISGGISSIKVSFVSE